MEVVSEKMPIEAQEVLNVWDECFGSNGNQTRNAPSRNPEPYEGYNQLSFYIFNTNRQSSNFYIISKN